MVPLQSTTLSLPPSSSPTTSFLFEPNSLSLALMHSDSSVSIFPSLPFPSLSSLPTKPQTSIPPPITSSSFLLLQQNPSSDPTVLFLVAGPHKGGSQILMKFFVFQKRFNLFSRVNLVLCTQKGIGFDSKLGGVLLDVNHGVSLKIVGSVNFFVLHSVSSKKVWVFAVKLVGDNGDGGGCDVVKVMRCAVIECCSPVWSICVSSGFLILGEDNGVRVFNLRHLVKDRVKRVKSSSSNLEGKGIRLPNGLIGNDGHGVTSLGTTCNGFLDRKIDKHCVLVKHRSVRCREDSDEGGAAFVAFKSKNVEGLKGTSMRALSIQALSPQKFVILDSAGDLHILYLFNPVGGSSFTSSMRRLPHSMSVQKLAVLPGNQTFWVSDGFYSVHMMTISDTDIAVKKDDGDDSREKPIQISVVQAIFSAEKIQDIVPLAPNGILILGQGNIYAHSIP